MTVAPAEAKTLLEFLLDLLSDDHAREAFQHDPQKALNDAGLGDVTLQEIKELLPLVLDRCDPHKAADYEHECHHYEGPCPPAHCPPHLAHCDDRPSHHHDVEMAKVVTHLNYVTNNYSFDSHDTIFNNNTNIVNLGDGTVNFDQNIDFHPVSADHGGTAVGGNNNAPITHGNGNVVGDDNQVSGAGSHTAFGAGSVYDHVGTGDGGAITFGTGNATGNYAPVDSHAHTTVHGTHNNVGDGTQTNLDTSQHDVGNTDSHAKTYTDDHSHTDNSVDHSVHGNGNHVAQDTGTVSDLHLPLL